MTWSLKHCLTRKLTEIAPLGTYRLGTPIFGHFSALMLWESAVDFFCGLFRKKELWSPAFCYKSRPRARARGACQGAGSGASDGPRERAALHNLGP